jgi:hypothetical protein
MRHAISWVAALVVPVLLLVAPAAAQKKPVDKDLEKSNDVKMVKAGVLIGKVVAVYEDKRKIRLQVAVPKLNPNGLVAVMNAQRAMATARTIQARIQAQQQMAQAQGQLYTTENKDIELEALEDEKLVVRTASPRQEFDEKGKIKKLTKKELAELKGPDKKLPGYKAEFTDLQPEQVIQVTLVKKKGSTPKPRLKKKGKDADADIDVLADNLPQVSRIIILREPPPSK